MRDRYSDPLAMRFRRLQQAALVSVLCILATAAGPAPEPVNEAPIEKIEAFLDVLDAQELGSVWENQVDAPRYRVDLEDEDFAACNPAAPGWGTQSDPVAGLSKPADACAVAVYLSMAIVSAQQACEHDRLFCVSRTEERASLITVLAIMRDAHRAHVHEARRTKCLNDNPPDWCKHDLQPGTADDENKSRQIVFLIEAALAEQWVLDDWGAIILDNELWPLAGESDDISDPLHWQGKWNTPAVNAIATRLIELRNSRPPELRRFVATLAKLATATEPEAVSLDLLALVEPKLAGAVKRFKERASQGRAVCEGADCRREIAEYAAFLIDAEERFKKLETASIALIASIQRSSLSGDLFQDGGACESFSRNRKRASTYGKTDRDCLVALLPTIAKSIRDTKLGSLPELVQGGLVCGGSDCDDSIRETCGASESGRPLALILAPDGRIATQPLTYSGAAGQSVRQRKSGQVLIVNAINGMCVPTGMGAKENGFGEAELERLEAVAEAAQGKGLAIAFGLPPVFSPALNAKCDQVSSGAVSLCFSDLRFADKAAPATAEGQFSPIRLCGDIQFRVSMPVPSPDRKVRSTEKIELPFECIGTGLTTTQFRDLFEQEISRLASDWTSKIETQLSRLSSEYGWKFRSLQSDQACHSESAHGPGLFDPAHQFKLAVGVEIPGLETLLCGQFRLNAELKPVFVWGVPSEAFRAELTVLLAERLDLSEGQKRAALAGDAAKVILENVEVPDSLGSPNPNLRLTITVNPSAFSGTWQANAAHCSARSVQVEFALHPGGGVSMVSDSKSVADGLATAIDCHIQSSGFKQDVEKQAVQFADAFAEALTDLKGKLRQKGFVAFVEQKKGSAELCFGIHDGDQTLLFSEIQLTARSDNFADAVVDFGNARMLVANSAPEQCEGDYSEEKIEAWITKKLGLSGSAYRVTPTIDASGIRFNVGLDLPRLGWVEVSQVSVTYANGEFKTDFEAGNAGAAFQKKLFSELISQPLTKDAFVRLAKGMEFETVCYIGKSLEPGGSCSDRTSSDREIVVSRRVQFPLGLDIECTAALLQISDTGVLQVLPGESLDCPLDDLKVQITESVLKNIESDAGGVEVQFSADCKFNGGFDCSENFDSGRDFVAILIKLPAIPIVPDYKIQFSDIVLAPDRLIESGEAKLTLPDYLPIAPTVVALVNPSIVVDLADLAIIRLNGKLTYDATSEEGVNEVSKVIRIDSSLMLNLRDKVAALEGTLVLLDKAAVARVRAELNLGQGTFGFTGETEGALRQLLPVDIDGCLAPAGPYGFVWLDSEMDVLGIATAEAKTFLNWRRGQGEPDNPTAGLGPGCADALKNMTGVPPDLIMFAMMKTEFIGQNEVEFTVQAKERLSDSSAEASTRFLGDLARVGAKVNPRQARADISALGVGVSIVTPDINGITEEEIRRIIESIISPEIPTLKQVAELLEDGVTIAAAPLTWNAGDPAPASESSKGKSKDSDAGQPNGSGKPGTADRESPLPAVQIAQPPGNDVEISAMHGEQLAEQTSEFVPECWTKPAYPLDATATEALTSPSRQKSYILWQDYYNCQTVFAVPTPDGRGYRLVLIEDERGQWVRGHLGLRKDGQNEEDVNPTMSDMFSGILPDGFAKAVDIGSYFGSDGNWTNFQLRHDLWRVVFSDPCPSYTRRTVSVMTNERNEKLDALTCKSDPSDVTSWLWAPNGTVSHFDESESAGSIASQYLSDMDFKLHETHLERQLGPCDIDENGPGIACADRLPRDGAKSIPHPGFSSIPYADELVFPVSNFDAGSASLDLRQTVLLWRSENQCGDSDNACSEFIGQAKYFLETGEAIYASRDALYLVASRNQAQAGGKQPLEVKLVPKGSNELQRSVDLKRAIYIFDNQDGSCKAYGQVSPKDQKFSDFANWLLQGNIGKLPDQCPDPWGLLWRAGESHSQ